MHRQPFCSYRKRKHARMLRRMAAMRAAKERKRMENPIEREPRMKRWCPLEFAVRDKVTGEVARVHLKAAMEVVAGSPSMASCHPPPSVAWEVNGLPDSEVTVLMRLMDGERPVWPGFHDGEHWREASAELVEVAVMGWMHLETAAGVLDAGGWAGGNGE